MRNLFFIVIFSLILTACQQETGQQEVNNNEPDDAMIELDEQERGKSEAAVLLMDGYKERFDMLMSDTNEDKQLISYNSMEDVHRIFYEVMSEELATWVAKTYFEEKGNELYLTPTDPPVWLSGAEPFDIEEIEEDKFKIVQEKNNEMDGHVNLNVFFMKRDTAWIIEKIEIEHLE